MIRLHVTYPHISDSEHGTLNCTTAGQHTYTDNMNYGISCYLPWQYTDKEESFDIYERWYGDHLYEEYPYIPHIPRDCRHSKLDASIRIRPKVKHSGTDTFVPYSWDTSRFVEDPGDDLFPKDHPYILHGGTRPVRPITDLTNPSQYLLFNTGQVTIVTLDRDRYHSMAPWRYYQVVRGKAVYPVYLATGNSYLRVPAVIIYDYSFSTRWEAGYAESWSSDETCTLDLHGTKLRWDFLNGVWRSGAPYNRIFRSNLTTSEVSAIFKGNPVIPNRFKLPTEPLWDWAPAGESLKHIRVFGFDKKDFRDNLYPVIASDINSIACRAAAVSLPRSTHQKDLHLQLIQDLSVFDSNLLLYFKDLPSTGSSVSTLVSALNNRNFSDVSAVWLTMRFADRLSFADTKELKESVEEALNRRSIVTSRLIKRHARDTQSYTIDTDFGEVRVVEQWNSSAFFKPRVAQNQQAYDELRLLCQEWDIISLENAWDAVPYSFVVDWIVNVAGCLNILDRNVQMWAYEISRIWDSVKRTIDVSAQLPRYSSMDVTVERLNYVQYSRLSPESLKLPVFTSPLEPIGEGLHNWKHIVDIGMLIIQRI
jgi:hypothetical protein